MKNLLKINGAQVLSRIEQKQIMGGGRPVGDFEDCHENDPGIGNQCSSNSGCAQNQICTEGLCACNIGAGGCLLPLPCPTP